MDISDIRLRSCVLLFEEVFRTRGFDQRHDMVKIILQAYPISLIERAAEHSFSVKGNQDRLTLLEYIQNEASQPTDI